MAGARLALSAIVFQAPPFGWVGSLIVALSVVVALLAYTTGVRWRRDSQPTRFGLLGLRLGAITCLFLMLLHPAWLRTQTVDERPIVAVVLDDSKSMGRAISDTKARRHEGAPVSDENTRYDRVLSVVRENLMPALGGSHRLRLYDVEARALRLDDLSPVADGNRSPLTDTLLCVEGDLRDDPLVAIALLSDGIEATDRPALGGLEQLRVPVCAIDVAGSGPEPTAAVDLSIQAISANRRALVGNTVCVAVDIAVEGDPGQAGVPVSILEGPAPIASRKIGWQPGERVVRTELEFVPRRPGEFTYALAVGALPGETELANNRDTFPLTVRAKPLTVLYIDGVLRWEGKFIREALAVDPDINVISSVRTARVGADRGSQGLLLPEQLASVDVVILGDVEAAYFAADEELRALRTWVTDSGGSLVLTGGYHSFGTEGFGRTVLRDTLPVEFSSSANPQLEQPFNLKLTDAGREHPIFHLSGDRVRDTAFFHKLPALSGCSRIAGVKPAAEVLALGPRIGSAAGDVGIPIMVVQQVGAGRTMVFAVDSTWRWRPVVGGFTGDSSFYERFWGQLVRWMAAEQEETPQRLFASTNRTQYRLGETIRLNVQMTETPRASAHRTRNMSDGGADESKAASSAWKVAAQALDETGKSAHVPLADLGDGRYRGTLAAARPGRLDLLVTAEPPGGAVSADGGAETRAQSRVVTVRVERPDLEMLNTRCDRQWLARVAQLTGGRLVSPDQIELWAQGLPADPVRMAVVRPSGAWGDWLFGGAFLVLTCAEWVLRRRRQLA